MAMFVGCSCGSRVEAQTWDCGLDKSCPSCGNAVRIPDLLTLKSLNGDRYPGLNAFQKIEQTAATREQPFDGTCHGCGRERSASERTVLLAILQERVLDDGGGLQIGPLGVKLVASGGIETWNRVEFPLMLCALCNDEYERDAAAGRFWKILKNVGVLSILGAFLALCYFSIELVAALSGLLWLVGLIAWAINVRGRPVGGTHDVRWASRIAYVEEALRGQEEYMLVVGKQVSS